MRALKLRTWLIVGYSAVLAVAALGLGLGLMSALNMANTSAHMVDTNFQALDTASRLRRLTSAQQLELTARLAEGDATAANLMPAFIEKATLLVQDSRKYVSSDEDRIALDRTQDIVDQLNRSVTLATAAIASGRSRSVALDANVVAGFEGLRTAALEHYQRHYDRMVERGNAIRLQSRRLAYALALLGIFTIAGGIWASVRIANRLSAPMEHLVRAADRVATGDFTVRTARSGVIEADRVALRFDEMVAALQRFHSMNLDRIVAERRRLDQVVANIDDGLIIFDENGRMERVNPVAALQLQLDADAAVGQRIDDITDMPELGTDVKRLLANPGAGPAANSDLTVGHDTARRTLSYSLLPFSDAARLGLILVLRDVTDQRRFERLRTEFILRASHELRTPITGMRMALGLLRDKLHFVPDTREEELFLTLTQETERLVALITELFDLSRLYARTYPHDTAPTPPGELLERALHRFQPMANAAGVRLDLRLPTQLPVLALDATAIERVFDNLIANALRHTPGGGHIELGASVGIEQVALWVEDNGDGISPADRARVFEPFMQLNGKVGGAGLGLAMCREIAEQHGGRMQLDSAVGKGSRFTVWLPI